MRFIGVLGLLVSAGCIGTLSRELAGRQQETYVQTLSNEDVARAIRQFGVAALVSAFLAVRR